MVEMNLSSVQELRRLNKEIGVKEQAGEVPYFDKLLADNFLFRRADGTIVDKPRYLDGLVSFAENPFERLETVVENVTLDGDSGVVNVLVIAKRKNMGSRHFSLSKSPLRELIVREQKQRKG